MAEPFGIATGIISIATIFTACVECFEYVQFGRHFGRDFQNNQLALTCARLRLTRWGESVHVYDDPKLGKIDASAAEIQLAKDILIQILVLFAHTESISKKFKSTAKNEEAFATFATSDMDSITVVLHRKLEQVAKDRQKGNRFLKLASWALYYRSEFKDLIEGIILLIDNIERLFFAPQTQATLVRRELAKIGNKDSIKLIEIAAEGVDSLLQTAVQEVLTGHQYSNITVRGEAHTGDTYSSDWRWGVIGGFHKYDGVVVENGGKAFIGKQHGGKGFWDN